MRIYLKVFLELFRGLTEAMSGAVAGLAVGPGLDETAQINPLVSATHRKTVTGYIEDAQSAGAELVQGRDGPEANGYYVRPTLVLNPDKAVRLTREEVFGPVLALTRVKDAEEALKLANDTEYGLSASLWTQNLNAAMNMIPRIEAGTVRVNSHVPIDPNLPFGGYKQSGIGRDFGPRWLDAYTEEKSVCIAH